MPHEDAQAGLCTAQTKDAKLKMGTGHKSFEIPAGLLQTKSTSMIASNILVSSEVSSSLPHWRMRCVLQ